MSAQLRETSAEAAQRWHRVRREHARRILAPPPRLTLSEWADRYRRISSTNSSEAGSYRTARVPYLREIMDACTDPDIERIVVKKSERVGTTEGLINNLVGYHMHLDPAPILIVWPTIDDAEKWSKEKLDPMLNETPILRERIAPPRAKDSSNTILNKRYPGGKISAVGTNSPRQLRGRDFRIVCCSEVDSFPVSSSDEGDPVAIAFRRADNFDNRKLILESRPSLEGVSRIDRAYKDSDRRRWWIRCPVCGHEQLLRWGGKDLPYGLKWVDRNPGTAYYLCEQGCHVTERFKRTMAESGFWRPENPGHPVRGYHIHALMSLLPGAHWPKITREWLEAQDSPELLQVFVNSVLGETYEERGERIEGDFLAERREPYTAEVPSAVGVLTASVDVHPDRLEVLVRGWGAGQESWFIRQDVLAGDLADAETQEALDAILFRPYQHEDGATLRIRATTIDSGYRATAGVYPYVKRRQRQRVYATKGDKQDPTKPIVTRAKKPNDEGVKLFTIGTYRAKRRMFSRLKQSRPGPGYMHFRKPVDEGEPNPQATSREYLRQFAAEKLMAKKDRFGQTVMEYIQVEDRNEAIDLECGAMAALYILGAGVYDHLEKHVARTQARGRRVRQERETASAAGSAPPAELPPDQDPEDEVLDSPAAGPVLRRPRRRGRGGFTHRF